MSALLKAFQESSHLYGSNAPFIEDLYERYLQDPQSVPEEWRRFFDRIQEGVARDAPHTPVREAFRRFDTRRAARLRGTSCAPEVSIVQRQAAVLRLIDAYRIRGHQDCTVDPLALRERKPVPDLALAYHGLTEADLDTEFDTGTLYAPDRLPLREILRILRETYCGNLSSEYMYLNSTEQKRWIQQRLESVRARPRYEPGLRRRILERITAAEGLERYLHAKYVGQKRFSLEGGESLIPLLDQLIQRAGGHGVKEIVIGMAHRGRLNVLVNILGKSPKELFEEFEGKVDSRLLAGDVKYHQGFSSDVETPGGPVHLALGFNPSHLEIISPVIEGSVRARQQRRGDHDGSQVLPVAIHGDAAFAGQGVVMETLNMSNTRGFTTGGTIHVIVNNQIGFTTSHPLDARSSLYCTDVAKMVEAPILHVNGDDPEAVVFAIELAVDYRMTFHRDVVVDLVCYRRHGHNEADEPAATQPMMYKKIRQHPTVREIYSRRLIEDGVIAPEDPERIAADYRKCLDEGRVVARNIVSGVRNPYAVDWSRHVGAEYTDEADTGVPLEVLRPLMDRLTHVPEDFELHPRVARILSERRKMAAGAQPLDWGFAETLAYATLLRDGHPVRISGQDSGRGTFFHRHAVLHNQRDGSTYVPLRNLFPGQPHFLVIDSLLSEEAVLGFEYGYATASPESLVIWEAQFGDFANGAQVVIDQFISSGEVKWGRLCHLVLFLPHGQEGQGPEHSSARLERFLQLCGNYNMQVCVPSTPAQAFHMLRRQMRRDCRKPLVVMTPKSLLRHKLATSTLEDLTDGRFQLVIGEVDELKATQVRRVVLCAGKVYYELLQERRERGIEDIAILRVEQLYPFPRRALKAELRRYRNAAEVVWCQEEPRNQGAWYQIRHHLQACKSERQELLYAGRPVSASPAPGYYNLHVEQQRALIDQALTLGGGS
ncbi:2-oxoglutarate dehydrogenase E1 component [Inmirania thermothiophila]|uniref:2-oxoglutarate dehydrogenase E1 component n=1 Tax=Inmirania thermothiophila TaxID=1750597 RepID=A0A3N1Y856_9GAMM|nr:2-oxoglutarate dehydrogenase E1 component [Inmirania thermothiophila]ROR35006.1 2-oxoglutarate dehydrogenase E1 component [Inmirania thermothiophila]